LSKVGDQIKFASFKQVPGGYVFRAPNRKVFGRSDHYLVDEAQRDKIVAIMTPRRPGLLLAAWVGGYFLAVAVGVVWLAVFAPGFPVTVLLVLIAAMLLAAILGLHLAAKRNLRRLQPILAGAPPTDQRITIAEIRQALNQRLSYRQLLRAGVGNAIACIVSAASVVVLIYVRKPGAGFFSEPLPLIFCFNAILLDSHPSPTSVERCKTRNMRKESAPRPPRFSAKHRSTSSPPARSHYSFFWLRPRR
jgi:hypothetical protein